MKHLIYIIALNLLSITPTLAQTCQTPPSCTELGYNMTAEDCSGKTSIKCPFDSSKIYCLTNESFCKDNESIIIKMQADTAWFLSLNFKQGITKYDFSYGDKLELSNDSSYSTKEMEYKIPKTGEFTIKICGTFTTFSPPIPLDWDDVYYISVISFNKPGLQKIYTGFGEYGCQLSGELPELPTSLVSAENLFARCTNMTGIAPPFSNFPNLTDYKGIFYNTQITNHPTDPWPDSAWTYSSSTGIVG